VSAGQDGSSVGLVSVQVGLGGRGSLTKIVEISWRMSTACWAAACFSLRSSPGILDVGGVASANEDSGVDVDVDVVAELWLSCAPRDGASLVVFSGVVGAESGCLLRPNQSLAGIFCNRFFRHIYLLFYFTLFASTCFRITGRMHIYLT